MHLFNSTWCCSLGFLVASITLLPNLLLFHLFLSLMSRSLSNLLVTVRSQPSGTWSVIGVSAVTAYGTAPNDALGRFPRENSVSSSHLSVVIISFFPPLWSVHYLLAMALSKIILAVALWCILTSHLYFNPPFISHSTALLFKVGQGPFYSQHCLFPLYQHQMKEGNRSQQKTHYLCSFPFLIVFKIK